MAAAAVAVAVALASVTSYFAVRSKLRGQVDQQLETRAGAVPRAVEKIGSLLRVQPGALGAVLPAPEFGGPNFYGQVISADGGLAGHPELSPALPPSERAREVAAGSAAGFLADQHVQGIHLRVLTEPVGPGFAAQIALPTAQWIAIPTKSVCASARAAVPDGATCESRPSVHSGEPAPNTRVMSPEGSTLVGP